MTLLLQTILLPLQCVQLAIASVGTIVSATLPYYITVHTYTTVLVEYSTYLHYCSSRVQYILTILCSTTLQYILLQKAVSHHHCLHNLFDQVLL